MAGNRNPDGTFCAGNNGGPGAPPGGLPGAGAPSRREDVRWHGRHQLETPEDELPKVHFSKGARLVAAMIDEALSTEGRKVEKGKSLIEAFYGAKSELTGKDGAALFSRIERVIVKPPAK